MASNYVHIKPSLTGECSDLLRDTAGLALCDVGLAERVEQRGLAVVDVAHDGHDGRARRLLDAGIGLCVFFLVFLVFCTEKIAQDWG